MPIPAAAPVERLEWEEDSGVDVEEDESGFEVDDDGSVVVTAAVASVVSYIIMLAYVSCMDMNALGWYIHL